MHRLILMPFILEVTPESYVNVFASVQNDFILETSFFCCRSSGLPCDINVASLQRKLISSLRIGLSASHSVVLFLRPVLGYSDDATDLHPPSDLERVERHRTCRFVLGTYTGSTSAGLSNVPNVS
jgi:hypothetical protein